MQNETFYKMGHSDFLYPHFLCDKNGFLADDWLIEKVGLSDFQWLQLSQMSLHSDEIFPGSETHIGESSGERISEIGRHAEKF